MLLASKAQWLKQRKETVVGPCFERFCWFRRASIALLPDGSAANVPLHPLVTRKTLFSLFIPNYWLIVCKSRLVEIEFILLFYVWVVKNEWNE